MDGRRACSRALAGSGDRVAPFGDAAARLLDARARGAVRRRAVRPGVLVRTRAGRSSGDRWQSLHDGQRHRQPGGAPTGRPRRRALAPRSLARCHRARLARNARRSHRAARRPSRPVGTRSARSGSGGRARVHGLGGRRRAPAESRIRQARAGSDGPPRAPIRCCGAAGETGAAGSAGPSARRADHLQVPTCALCRPHRAAGADASATQGRRAPQPSSATSLANRDIARRPA